MRSNHKLALALVAILALLMVASASFLSFGDYEFVQNDAELEVQHENPTAVELRALEDQEDEEYMNAFEASAAHIEGAAELDDNFDSEGIDKMRAEMEEAVERENEHEAEGPTDQEIASFLEKPNAKTQELIKRVDAALKFNDASWGIADMAKPQKKMKFPKISKGVKTQLNSALALAKIKDELAEAPNTKRSIIQEMEGLEKDTEKFIAQWEQENGGHWCIKQGNCKK